MDLKIGLIFLFQIIVGILGNFSLLLRYIFLDLSGYKLRSMDSIVRNLTVANILLILSRGIPETVAAFAWKDVLHGFACTLVFYVHRVARGVSMATTCLLTVFQAITISPRNSKWAKLKGKAPKYIGPSTALCWVLYSLINIRVLLFMFGKSENVTENKYSGHCSQLSYNTITESLYQALVACLDVLCLGLMFWSSVSMVAILQRHKKQVQHIHRSSPSLRASPETRATQTILVLVSTFVSIYALSSALAIYFTAVAYEPLWLLVVMGAFTNGCFPAVSPFILMTPLYPRCAVCAPEGKHNPLVLPEKYIFMFSYRCTSLNHKHN